MGKTSLGRSVARALGREFVRISLGGVRDEAEIRGHRRTYIGALPGRIIQGMKRAGTKNPIFMLDEIDKLGADFRGDPSSALLEVLDPEQNNSFSRPLPRGAVRSLGGDLHRHRQRPDADPAGAARPHGGPRGARLHREEKLHIASSYLVPKQLEEHGLTVHQIGFTDGRFARSSTHYTREAGVRNLEREIANVVRGVAVKVASGETIRAELRARGRG